jgi:dihydropteroate synthase
MGILNVTPDSFSDGGRFSKVGDAIACGLQMMAEGADIVDIGGESTRPGALPVSAEAELDRVLPVVRGLAQHREVSLSIDTSKASVAKACLDAGATIINDVSALADPEMAAVIKQARAGLVLMHMKGNPQTMQVDPRYENVVGEVSSFLKERLASARAGGIEDAQIAIDPGIGFGKTFEHNGELLGRLHELQHLGRPVCLGVSRKSVVSGILPGRSPQRRLVGSLTILCFAMAQQAVQIIRVHDVEETRDAITVYENLTRWSGRATAPAN